MYAAMIIIGSSGGEGVRESEDAGTVTTGAESSIGYIRRISFFHTVEASPIPLNSITNIHSYVVRVPATGRFNRVNDNRSISNNDSCTHKSGVTITDVIISSGCVESEAIVYCGIGSSREEGR